MIYPNKPLYLLSLLGYIYYLTYYTLTTKDNIIYPLFRYFRLYFSYDLTHSFNAMRKMGLEVLTISTNTKKRRVLAYRF